MPANDPRGRAWRSTGHKAYVDPEAMALDRLPAYDSRSGDHLWLVMTSYRVVPALWTDPTHTPQLDQENLVSITPPFCYHCEQAYTPLIGSRRCKGEPR